MTSNKSIKARARYSAPVCKSLDIAAETQFLQVSCTNDQIGDWTSDTNEINL